MGHTRRPARASAPNKDPKKINVVGWMSAAKSTRHVGGARCPHPSYTHRVPVVFCIVPKGNRTRSSSHRNRDGKEQTVEVGLAEGRGTPIPGKALKALASLGDRPAIADALETAQTFAVFERTVWRSLKRLGVAGATDAPLDR